MDNALINSSLNENRFWLQIMGDHARFIYYSLVPSEVEFIKTAKEFMGSYDDLLVKSRRQLASSEVESLNRQAVDLTRNLREYKLQLLALTLHSKLKVHLPSTFFNHMINELEEYLLVLTTLERGRQPVYEPIHHHLLWLLDGFGHAAAVGANLDEIESDYIEKSNAFQEQFKNLYLKSVEVKDYMRTDLKDFPSLQRLNTQAESAMNPFRLFLEEIRDMRFTGRLLGTLMPLMADHMAREECYYLIKLSEVSSVKKPNCDPARHRMEA